MIYMSSIVMNCFCHLSANWSLKIIKSIYLADFWKRTSKRTRISAQEPGDSQVSGHCGEEKHRGFAVLVDLIVKLSAWANAPCVGKERPRFFSVFTKSKPGSIYTVSSNFLFHQCFLISSPSLLHLSTSHDLDHLSGFLETAHLPLP